MFTPKKYREQATAHKNLAEVSERLVDRKSHLVAEQRFRTLADNEQLLADNYRHSVQQPGARPGSTKLAAEEEHVLRCLGAAVVMQWNTLPRKLQRELFDSAGSVGDLLATEELRGQIARFLHKLNNF